MSDKKSNKKEELDSTVPVFRMKPITRTSSAIIQHVGYVNDQQKLGDEEVELDKPLVKDIELWGKHAIPICKVGEYDLFGRIYRSNIVGDYIVNCSRYPVIYLTVSYHRSLVSGSLLQLYISIDMSQEDKKKIKTPRDYVKLRVDGQYVRHVDCDKEMTEDWKKVLNSKLENKVIKEMQSDIDLSNPNESSLENIENKIESEFKKCEALMEDMNLNRYENLEIMRNKFIDLCNDPSFHLLLEVAMECRVTQRRNQSGIKDDEVYVVPKQYINMADVKNKLIEDGELI